MNVVLTCIFIGIGAMVTLNKMGTLPIYSIAENILIAAYLVSVPASTATVIRNGINNAWYKYAFITNIINVLIGVAALGVCLYFNVLIFVGIGGFIIYLTPAIININKLRALKISN